MCTLFFCEDDDAGCTTGGWNTCTITLTKKEKNFEITMYPISQQEQQLKLGGVPTLIRMKNQTFRKINLTSTKFIVREDILILLRTACL